MVLQLLSLSGEALPAAWRIMRWILAERAPAIAQNILGESERIQL